MQSSLHPFIHDLPKAEIHIHLEGAINPATVLKLAQRHQKEDTLPGQTVAELQRWFTFTDFPHFIEVYKTIQDLLRTAVDFETIAYECGVDMAAQNIRYREVTITPYTHTHMQDKGITIHDILDGLEAGRQRASADFGVEIRWVFDIARSFSFPQRDGRLYDPMPANTTLEYALLGKERGGVVGFGLGGYEVNAPPEPFAHAFAIAKETGLLSVPHAGETVGPASIWGAINKLDANRIGHGVRAIEDPNLLALLKERQIPLEINPTSNICLNVYPDLTQHPFRQLDELGLFVTLNSDDPPLFNTTLEQEYQVLTDVWGYGRSDIIRIARNAYLASGADAATKSRLLAEFDAWVTVNQ